MSCFLCSLHYHYDKYVCISHRGRPLETVPGTHTFRVLCGFNKGGGRGTESREQGEVVDEGEPRTLTERTLLATWSAPPAAGVNRTAGVAAPALLAQAAGAHGHLPLPRGAVLSPPALLSESARRVARA